ncbi:MAG: trehalose-phosphatase, partial [Actinomycetota bacterium]
VGSATKGDAMVILADRCRSTTSVYLGDDVTDEDAFEVLGPDDAGIKVGPGATRASHRVGTPDDVVAFLQALADRRTDRAA